MEKKTTVPPSAVARIAPCSAPGHVDADDGDVGRRPDAPRRPPAGRWRRRRPPVGQARPRSARRPRASVADQPGQRGRRRRRRAAARRQGAGLARRARGRRPTAAPVALAPPGRSAPARRTRRARRATTASGQVVGQHGGDRAGEQDRRALAPAPARERPSQRASPSVIAQRGQRERDQGGHPVADGAGPSGDSGPTSSTTPMSMPPEPVTGFCILPRVGDDLQDGGADRVAVPAVRPPTAAGSDAASRLSRSHARSAPRRRRSRGRRPAAARPGAARRPARAPGAARARRSRRSVTTSSLPSHSFVAEEPIASRLI